MLWKQLQCLSKLCWVSPEMLQLKPSVLKFLVSGVLGLAGRICLSSPVSQYTSLACWGSGVQPAVPKAIPDLVDDSPSWIHEQEELQSPADLCPSLCWTVALRITCRFIALHCNLRRTFLSLFSQIYSSFCLEIGLFFFFNWVICLQRKYFILCCMFQGLSLCHFHFI